MEVHKEVITLEIHSPVHELRDPLFQNKRVRVFIKRDDLIHPFISGNKWRKLKYTLIRARESQKNHLVTFGGPYSNHLVATACAGAKFGFRTTAFVRGEEVTNSSLMFCRMFGMNLIFTSRQQYRNKPALFEQHFQNDNRAFFVDEGGSGEDAVTGCSELINELDQTFNHIFCAAGTGATAAGLLKGISNITHPPRLHAVSSLKNGFFLKDDIANYHSTTDNLVLHCDYHFGGYAKTTPELLTFISKFTASTGILLDQVYTGKAAYAMYDLLNRDYFEPESKILFVHTGGLLGLLSQAESF